MKSADHSSVSSTNLLSLESVTKSFVQHKSVWSQLISKAKDLTSVFAVDHVDLNLVDQEVVGLVGESGCGKSTLGRMAAGLMKPDEGSVKWLNKDIAQLQGEEQLQARLSVQMVFQDAYASLNPRFNLLELLTEAPIAHGLLDKKERIQFAQQLLSDVGLSAELMHRYAHQLSGGQRSRLAIARALGVNPRLMICDEAVAALDVSVQAQVLNLFMKLREERRLTYLFISHDLGVVRHLTDRVMIMYLGRIVEQGHTAEVFSHPNHPYTKALISHIPEIKVERKLFTPIQGEIPSAVSPPTGCHFHPRCPHAMKICCERQPLTIEVSPNHFSACHLN